jgi:solute:Na+ symporter, SSS family
MTPLDLIVTGLFLAGIAALGFSARVRESSVIQYLAAGRKLSLPAFVATLVSSWYGGILGVGESVAGFGLGTWILMGLPYYVFGVFYAVRLAPRVREGEQISIPERFEARFGNSAAVMAAILLFLLAVPAAHVLMLGVLVQTLFGVPIAPAVLIASGLGLAFLWRGGLLADVRVAMLAFLAMYAGFFAIDFWSLVHNPPGRAFAELQGTPLWTWDGGQGPLFVLSFFVLGAWTLVDPGFHQRVASAQSPEVGKRGVLISVAFWMLFDLLSITAGLYAVVTVPDVLGSASSLDRLAAMPRLGQTVLPDGLRALFFCGMLGTIVSAMVGYALISGATIGREVYARLRREKDEAAIQLSSKVGIVLAFGVAIAVGLSLESVVSLWYSWAGAVVGAVLIPLLASYDPRARLRASPLSVALAMAVSALASFGMLGWGLRTGNPYLVFVLEGQTVSVGTLLPGLAVSALILVPAHILAIIRRRP